MLRVVALLLAALPVLVALADAHLASAPLALVVSTATGAAAVSALALQGVLAARPRLLDRIFGGGQLRWHRRIGAATLLLVLVHLGFLFAYDVRDTLFTLSLDGPTRSRMASIATLALLLTVALGVGRARLGLRTGEWRVLHGFLAVLVVVLGVGHAVWTQGAMDGEGTVVLVAFGLLGLLSGLWVPVRRRWASAARGPT